jgi:predicted  nucleic acid-binding Zn-ribbon protein
MHDETFTREEKADLEVDEINRTMDKETREAEHEKLKKECAKLKADVDEISRQISLLEYALIRS